MNIEAQNTVDLLNAIENAILKAQDEVRVKSKALVELIELSSHNEELEAEIEEAKGKIFGLLFEKLRSAELIYIDEYAALIERDIQSMVATGKDGAKAEAKK